MHVQPARHSLIDAVVYLASLASNPRAIDPDLDVLRGITATLPPAGQPTKEQETALLGVKQKLETYLVTQEPIRAFTSESLQIQLEQYLSGGNTRRAAQSLAGVLGLAIVGTGLVAMLLRGADPDVQLQVAGTVFFALLHIGAVYLFIVALASFTTKLRRAFRWICTGIVILGLSLVLQPIIELLGLRGTTISSLMDSVPVLVAAIAVYIGTQLYAYLVGLALFRRTAIVAAAVIAATSVTVVLLPHAPSHLSEAMYGVVMSILAATIILSATTTIVLYKMTQRMADLYRVPTQGLALAIGVATTVSLYIFIYRAVLGGLTSGPATWIMIALVSIMGFAFLYSGYVFNKSTRY